MHEAVSVDAVHKGACAAAHEAACPDVPHEAVCAVAAHEAASADAAH